MKTPDKANCQHTKNFLKNSDVKLNVPSLVDAIFKNICDNTKNRLCIEDRTINLSIATIVLVSDLCSGNGYR